jgi:hypothetical protein
VRVQVLDEATGDLADGCRFYERQAEGLGEYFLDSLWSDINSLRMYAGVHAVHHGYHRLLSKRFPFAVYYRIEDAWLESAPFWTAVVIRSGLKTA